MASEHYKCNAEYSIIHTDGDETEKITSGTRFVDINDILKREIKEETTEFKPFSEYECLEKHENEQFYDPVSNELEVSQRNGVEDPKESKFSPNDLWENTDLGGGLAKPKVNHFNNGVILKNEDEDHSEYIDLLTNNAGLKTETLKTEDPLDIIYEDVKPDICEEKPNKLIGTDIGPNLCHEFLKVSKTWPQQNIEEHGKAVERDNDRSKESTMRIDSNNSQMVQQFPYCKYSKLYPSESKKGHLTEHKIIHSGEKPFQCIVCFKNFASKNTLLRHERIHTGEKPFQCKICLKSFSQTEHLRAHERIHTGEKPFQCKVCPKSFISKYKLLRHKKIHTGEKPFQCKVCQKSFVLEYTLLYHERIHTGEKQFQCKICLNSFAYKSTLLVHEKIHTDGPFLCKICSKSFSQMRHLREHEKRHIGEKPFHCKICPKSFADKSSLSRHKRIHTGENAYQCKFCLKSFSRKLYLTRHETIHTGEEPI